MGLNSAENLKGKNCIEKMYSAVVGKLRAEMLLAKA
jgi:hypothetical protein